MHIKVMHRRRKLWFVAGIVVALTAFGAIPYARMYYPYGSRPAFLPCLLDALRSYANDNGGQFPNIGQDGYRSLQRLYPRYIQAEYLAGLSGSQTAVRKSLNGGGNLDQLNCSWVYLPGFSNSEPADLAIVWERESGIGFNGRAVPGRAVGLLSGRVVQIPDKDWPEFLRQQAIMRSTLTNLSRFNE